MVSKSLYQMGVMTLIAAVLWISFGIYQIIAKPEKIEVEASILEPITTNLDQETVNALVKRVKIDSTMISKPSATIEEGETNEPIN